MRFAVGFARQLFFFCFACALSTPPQAVAEHTDLNGDGLSDIVLIEIKPDGALSWQAYSPSNLAPLFLAFQQGKVGDHITPAQWTSVTSAQLGYLSTSGSTVRWNVNSGGSGPLRSFRFGQKGDLLISGADFNGNGYSDAAFVRRGESGLVWTVRRDPLAPSRIRRQSRSKLTVRFGKASDLAFYASPKGRLDWFAVLRERQAGGSLLIMRNPTNGRTKRLRLASHLFSELRPIPLRQQSGQNLLALPVRKGSATQLTFVGLARGAIVAVREVAANGELLVGNFSAAADKPGQEIAVQTGSGFAVVNPYSSNIEVLTLPSGVSVDQININGFEAGGGGGSGQPCKNETRNPYDGGEGFLWKPVSDSTGKLAILMPANLSSQISSIVVKSPAGQLLETGAYGGIGNGNRYHARFSKPGGQYPDGSSAVANLKGGCTVTYVIDETSRRVD